jgi:dienelactone hydrolase
MKQLPKMTASKLRTFFIIACLSVCLWIGYVIKPAATLPESTPWDLEALSAAPGFEWLEQSGKMRSLKYKGLQYKENQQTSVFAYYCTPGILAGDASLDKNLPAMVLVHGGGGCAFKAWAELWASYGYAAIAMDLAGCGVDRKRLEDGGPDQSDNTKFGNIDKPVTEQWTYHAVANVILAHSLIRSFAEVDAERTGLTGISWGGYLTCITSGLDNRFKAACPVYGCGFLHQNSCWLPWFEDKFTPEQSAKWVKLWDPSSYVGFAAMPMLFVNGGRDFAYPPDSHAKTYGLVKSEKNLYYVPDLSHGHIFDRPKEIKVFIDSQLGKEVPLPRFASLKIGDKQIHAEVESQSKLVSASLHSTTDPIRVENGKRNWISESVTSIDNKVCAPILDEKKTIWFLSVTDERGMTVSSELQF